MLASSSFVKVWDYGDSRFIIVAIRNSVNNADDYDMPEPVFTAANLHTARSTAVPDEEVPAYHWRKDPLEIFYPYAKPAPGDMHRRHAKNWTPKARNVPFIAPSPVFGF